MPERAPSNEVASIESRSGFAVQLLTEENQAKCPRLKAIPYSHPLYGDTELEKLVFCSEHHDHQMEWLFTWNAGKNNAHGGWDKALVPVFSQYNAIIPTEEAFEKCMIDELRRFDDLRRKSKSSNLGLAGFLKEHQGKHTKPRLKPGLREIKQIRHTPAAQGLIDSRANHPFLPPAKTAEVRFAVQEAVKGADAPIGEKRVIPKDDIPPVDDSLFPDEM